MSRARENFVRLAESRTRRAIKNIRLVGNLSNRSNYSWTSEDVAKIFSALEHEIRSARGRFKTERRSSDDIEFTLE